MPQERQQNEQDEQSSGTYQAGCHCGYIKFSVTLTPALPQTKVLNCNCSACTRFGYLLVCASLFPSDPLCLLLQQLSVRTSPLQPGQEKQKEKRLKQRYIDPEASSVTWHNNSRARCTNYRFNTKDKDQMFCKHCGASIGIDFREVHAPKHIYGISVSLVKRKGCWCDVKFKMETNRCNRFELSSTSISTPLPTANWMDATRFRQRGTCPVSTGMRRRMN